MSELIGIVGPSGSGKSTSIESLNPKETVIINIAGKQLPFRGWKKNYVEGIMAGGNYASVSDSKTVCDILTHINTKRPEIKQIILDDAGYSMSFQYMAKAHEKGFDKFSIIAKDMFNILDTARKLRSDLKVVVIFHDEVESEGNSKKRKIRTIGKMLDSTITLEGLFTVVLFTDVIINNASKQAEYSFVTQTDGITTAKSPKGMFETTTIPNDLQKVIEIMDAYYLGE